MLKVLRTYASSLVERITPTRYLFDKVVEKNYIQAGLTFGGDYIDLPGLGEHMGFEKNLNDWAYWENEYARRGYRTISLISFMNAHNQKEIEHLIGQKRNQGEEPVLFGEKYKRLRAQKDITTLGYDDLVDRGVLKVTSCT